MLRGGFERRPVGEDLPAVLVEPALRAAVLRPPALDELPELRTVMMLDQVADLVHDDVVENVVRREHEPPVEAERALARARAPAAALVAQRDALVGDAECGGFGLRDQRDARTCLAPPLLLRESQPLEAKARLDRLLELLREPVEVGGDRGVDLGVRRPRAHDELGREPVAHDDAMAAHAARAAYVHLHRTTA